MGVGGGSLSVVELSLEAQDLPFMPSSPSSKGFSYRNLTTKMKVGDCLSLSNDELFIINNNKFFQVTSLSDMLCEIPHSAAPGLSS